MREASVASKDEAEFVRRLRGSGPLVRPRFETGGKEAVVGYSVALRTGDGDTRIWFGGGRLARDLTFPNLRQFWELTAEDRKGRSPNGALPSRLSREEKPSSVARTTGNGHWRASRGPRRSSGQSRSPTSPRGGGPHGKHPESLPPGRDALKGTAPGRWGCRKRVGSIGAEPAR